MNTIDATVAELMTLAKKMACALANQDTKGGIFGSFGVAAGQARSDLEAALRSALTKAQPVPPAEKLECTRSHPHENMDALCELRTVIARLENEKAQKPAAVGAVELIAKKIEQGWKDTFSTENPYCPCNLKSFTKAVRWAERAAIAAKGAL